MSEQPESSLRAAATDLARGTLAPVPVLALVLYACRVAPRSLQAAFPKAARRSLEALPQFLPSFFY